MRISSGSTDKYIYFVAVDSTDFTTRETGLTSFTVYRSRNGAAAAAMTTPTINEVDATNMPGVYELLLDEDMTIGSGNDTEEMVFHITQASMAPVTRSIELYRPKITIGNTLTVAADGDLTEVNTLTGHTVQTGDSYARLGSPAGASVSADIAENQTDLNTIIADTNELQTDWTNGGRLDLILDELTTQGDTNEGKIDTIDANVDTLLTRITSTLFSGITSLAEWLGLIAGKQTGDTTARTELRATGAGSGTYDETTDSQEALRDHVGDGTNLTEAGGDGDHLTEAGGTGDQLSAIPWNASWDAEVQSECADALAAIDLDHLVNSALPTGWGTDVAAGSVFDNIADDGTASFDRTTDSLQAIRDRGDASWTTGGGSSITQSLNVQPVLPTSIDLADTSTVRLGLILVNALDDLPSTTEITPGTISIERKAIGGTSWSAVVTDSAMSEQAGMVYFDEVFDSGTGYAEGDSIRVTFKSVSITADANTHEICDANGVLFQTYIRETMRGTDSAYTGTPPTAVQIRTEIDSNSTQLSAIVTDTNELQTDWTDGGRLDLLIDAIKAVTDNLNDPTTAAIADAVWDEATSGHNTQGTFGRALLKLYQGVVAAEGDVNDVSATTTSFVTDLTEATDDHYNDKILAFVGGSLDGQGRTIVDYDGTSKTITLDEALTEAPSNGDSFVILAVQTHTLNEIADAVWDEVITGAEHNVNNSAAKYLREASEVATGVTGNLQSATSTTAVLAVGAITADDFYNGERITIIEGTGAGQSRLIMDSTASSDTVTVGHAWTTTPDSTSVYAVTGAEVDIRAVSEQAVTATATVDYDDLAAILADTDELQSDNVPGLIAALNDLDAAGIRSAVGLAAANLDTQLGKADLTAALTEAYRSTGATGSAAQLLYEILAHLGEFAINSTTKTTKKLDGSTTAKTYTLDDDTNPTSITETT